MVESNSGPSCCEATALITAPPCCPFFSQQLPAPHGARVRVLGAAEPSGARVGPRRRWGNDFFKIEFFFKRTWPWMVMLMWPCSLQCAVTTSLSQVWPLTYGTAHLLLLQEMGLCACESVSRTWFCSDCISGSGSAGNTASLRPGWCQPQRWITLCSQPTK